MKPRPRSTRYQRGVSYVEVLTAAIIIAVAVIPAMTALRGAMDTAEADTEATARHFQLVAKMEQVLAEPFTAVSAAVAGPASPSTYSDAPGSTDRRLVFVSLYDGDNADVDGDPFTGADPDLLWVRVEIEGTLDATESLKAN